MSQPRTESASKRGYTGAGSQSRLVAANSNPHNRRGSSNSRNILQRSSSHTSRNSARLAAGVSSGSLATGRGSQSARRKGPSANIAGTSSAAAMHSCRAQIPPALKPQKSHRSTTSNKQLQMPTSGRGNAETPSLMNQYEQKITQMVQHAKEAAASHVTEATRRKFGDVLHHGSPGANGGVGKKHIIQTSLANGAAKVAQQHA